MNKSLAAAKSFLAAARTEGFTVVIKSETCVAVVKSFTPGDLDAFSACDCSGPMLLSMVPLKGGTVWGTDGGSVGGYSAVKHGQYTLNKAGTGARFVAALRKAMQES